MKRRKKSAKGLRIKAVGLLLAGTAVVWGSYELLQVHPVPSLVADPSDAATPVLSSTTAAGGGEIVASGGEGELGLEEVLPAASSAIEEEVWVKKRSTISETLKQLGLAPSDIHRLVRAARPLFNLSRVQAGTRINVLRSLPDETIDELQFHLSHTRSLILRLDAEGKWQGEMREKQVVAKELAFYGDVKSNLWSSAVEAGLHGQAIYRMADIFGWQIDFEREVMPGDGWRVLIERLYVDDKPYGWGNIIIAEYQRGGDLYSAIRYPTEGEEAEYFNWDGESLRGKFLKSPLRFSRISSRFNIRRFHPILGVNRPHYGVDYAAPTGTPVRSVGDGKIITVGRRGGSGKMIKIRHNATYHTAYKHLNGYAKGMVNGAKVSQGQVIGYVGSTGLATGPHLHFEFYEGGQYVDPLGKKFPREEVVPAQKSADFKRIAEIARQKLAKGLKEMYQIAEKAMIPIGEEKVQR